MNEKNERKKERKKEIERGGEKGMIEKMTFSSRLQSIILTKKSDIWNLCPRKVLFLIMEFFLPLLKKVLRQGDRNEKGGKKEEKEMFIDF